MSEWTNAWWQRPLRYKRWPHFKWSSGWHHWRIGKVVNEGGPRRRWHCVRCGGTVLVWPLERAPLLRRGERVVSACVRAVVRTEDTQ